MRGPVQIVFLLLTLVQFSVMYETQQCTKPNEHRTPLYINTCGGSACTERGMCDKDSWKSGCTCHDGYRRDEAGNCIPARDCPPINCSRFAEIYDSSEARCQRNCDWPNGVNLYGYQCGERISQEGCICIQGYVRDARFNCVPVDKCPQAKCPLNEHYAVCSGYCEATCQNPQGLHPRCNASCEHGCSCNAGYVRGPTGRCIKPEDCPGSDAGDCATSDEKYSDCEAHCQATCEMKIPIPVYPCILCHPGCVCKRGYARDRQDKCIELKHCRLSNEGRYSPQNGGNTDQNFGSQILMGIGVVIVWIEHMFASF